MFETMATFLLVEHANGAMFTPPLGPAVYPRTVARDRKPYPTKDGHVAVLIYNDKHWNAFVRSVKPAWIEEYGEAFASLEQRAKQIDVMYALIGQTLAERTTAEWLDLFRELEIPAAAIQTPDELFDDPHLNAVGLFETVDTAHGPVRFPGVPTWFSRTPGRVAGPAPELGADTDAVLAEVNALHGPRQPVGE